jgi:hypothetical protein
MKPWISLTFAPAWYTDAIEQTKLPKSRDSLRREIIFAVCATESYLYEWVRDEVLKHDYPKQEKYFPPGDRSGITKRWKEVVRQLAADNYIPRVQNFVTNIWTDFRKLALLRNGLVHGLASRPEELPDPNHPAIQPKDAQPLPSPTELDQLVPGWPTRVVHDLLADLHATVGTPAPSWLVHP